MFANIVACWHGSTHYSHVFRTSNLATYVEKHDHSLDDSILLGDSGYACSRYLMTPYSSPNSRAEKHYSNAHTKMRVVIEQTFGRWKRRFHVPHSEVRMAPEKVCAIIGACAVLHNLAIILRVPIDDVVECNDGTEIGPYIGCND